MGDREWLDMIQEDTRRWTLARDPAIPIDPKERSVALAKWRLYRTIREEFVRLKGSNLFGTSELAVKRWLEMMSRIGLMQRNFRIMDAIAIAQRAVDGEVILVPDELDTTVTA